MRRFDPLERNPLLSAASSLLCAASLLLSAEPPSAQAASGTWSNFGPTLPSVPPYGHCLMPIDHQTLYVPSNTTVYTTPLENPALTALANGWSGAQPYRLGINALGHPIANAKTSALYYYDGTVWKTSTLTPAPSGQQWWIGAVANIVLDPVTQDLFTAGNFTLMKSTDHGVSFQKLFDLGTVCPSGGGYGYIYTFERMPWGELIVGGESDTFYHSLDNGLSWSALPPFSKGGNRYGSSVTKDGEILLSTAPDASGNLIFRYTRDGKLVPAMTGLAVYQFNYQTTYAFHIAYSSSGENFMVPINNDYNDGLPHVIKWDGTSWTKIESLPNGPGTNLVWDQVTSDGTNIYVVSSTKQIKKWTPSELLPFKVNAGINQSIPAGGVATLAGQVTPQGTNTHSWAARGPGTVTFSNPTGLSTTATFSAVGDYVVNLQSSNGKVTAGASIIIRHGTDFSGCSPSIEVPYDGIDQDCSGADLIDVDGDGYPGTEAGGTDCNDSTSTVSPGTSEVCNGIDDNCSSTIDEGVVTTWYKDGDGDGYGTSSATTVACSRPTGFAAQAGDCDDTRSSVNPAATEVCNGIDDNCSSTIDEGVEPSLWYMDADGDGYGTSSITTLACSRPTGFAGEAGDCDDGSAATYPEAPELLDGQDNDCDGGVDEDFPIDPTPTPVPPTPTPADPTATPEEPTPTPEAPTPTPVEPTATPEDPTATPLEATPSPLVPTATPAQATPTPRDATATPTAATPTAEVATPTAIPVTPTATQVPATPVPVTATPVSVTATPAQTTSTPTDATVTPADPGATPLETTETPTGATPSPDVASPTPGSDAPSCACRAQAPEPPIPGSRAWMGLLLLPIGFVRRKRP